jgi:hypothetical protein
MGKVGKMDVVSVTTIKGDSVALTAEVIEAAYAALHAPQVVPPCLTPVAQAGKIGVVITGEVARYYGRYVTLPTLPILVVDQDGYGQLYANADELFAEWELA